MVDVSIARRMAGFYIMHKKMQHPQVLQQKD